MAVYGHLVSKTSAPSVHVLANELTLSITEVESALQALADQHLFVLANNRQDIVMALPFSGVETGFHCEVDGKVYNANCAWDCFGIAAAMKRDARISATCPDCEDSIELEIRDGKPLELSLIHI